MNRFFTIAVLLTLGACSFAPAYQRPQMAKIPAAYKENKGWKVAEPSDTLARGPWWHIYGDKTLDGLEAKLHTGNQDLKALLATYRQAKQAEASARADYFPAVTGSASFTRARSSSTVDSFDPGGVGNDLLANADLSYELDIWGRVRNEVAAAHYRTKASKADLAAMELSLRAELAGDYFTLRGDDAQQAILDQTVDADKKAYDLTVRRYQGGIAAATDVSQAETQYENARTQATDIHRQRAELEHAIAILVGEIPSNFSLPVNPLLDINPPVMKTGMPSSLLERRPDIAAAERRVAAANADIGVARAAWFPTFDFLGLFGFDAPTTSQLLTYPSRMWSFGPSLTAPIFEGGRILAENRSAAAAYDQAVANYRKTVLVAYQEVEDNLVALRQLEQEAITQAAATKAAKRTLEQAEYRYAGGVTTFLDVDVAQNQALQAQTASVTLSVARLNASIQLIKALGGGWR